MSRPANTGFWKRTARTAPVAKPSFVLPPDRNRQCLSMRELKDAGYEFITRKQPDGTTHVWRIK